MNCILENHMPSVSTIGGKACHLAALDRAGLPVPVWTVLPTQIFEEFLGAHLKEYEALLRSYVPQNRERILELLDQCDFSPCRSVQIEAHLKEIFGESPSLAVRSSAVDEDSSSHSMAGMLESVLNVRGTEAVFKAIRRCYCACFSERAMQYRARFGLISPEIRAAVIIQRMIPADFSGVMFTLDPTTNNPEETYISVVGGLGEGLVSGTADSSDYAVDTAGQIVFRQEREVHISDDVLRRLHAYGQQIEMSQKQRVPQDIEFCIQAQNIYILQSRPISSYRDIDKAAQPEILDNANIIESYSGVTTPLTFSFAREVYAKIYRQTLRAFSVSPAAIDSIAYDLDHMLAFYENKIYYRLNSWYRMTALYPGYQKNKRYMENMMGVSVQTGGAPGKTKTRLLRIYIAFLRRMLHIRRDSRRFLERFERVTAPYYGQRFEGQSNAQVLAVYDTLEREILDDFITPIANDMGAMVFYGMLTDQLKKQHIPAYEGLLSSAIARQGDVESVQQSEAVLKIVGEIRQSPELTALFLSENAHIIPHLQDSRPVMREINAYIRRFGARTMDELKLETVTLFEDPAFLLDTIRGYLRLDALPAPHQTENTKAAQALLARFSIPKRPWIRFLLRITKFLIRNRESLRLRRTYIYSIVRNIYLRAGENLAEAGVLAQKRDIFFLEKNEIAEIAAGHMQDIPEIRRRIAERKAAYEKNKAQPVYNRMLLYPNGRMLPVFTRQECSEGTNLLYGTAGGGQPVTGIVRLVESPAEADVEGYILMARRTDPGWTVLFPMAKAVIIEHGSVLSHSAVVAREMGIPLVAGIRGLTDRVKNNMRVRVDGSMGTVEILGGTDEQSE